MGLNAGKIEVAPSILGGDHANLIESLRIVESVGAKWLHIDIMDGHFVPNLTFGPKTVLDLRKSSELFFDVHLMLLRPDLHVDAFLDAGADLISIHVEPEYDIGGTLDRIRERAYSGIVMNPDCAFDRVVPYLANVDLVLQMTVFPGFGGQEFITDTMNNVSALRSYREEYQLDYRIEVDGGIDRATYKTAIDAGADTLVSGSSFFKDSDPAGYFDLLKSG